MGTIESEHSLILLLDRWSSLSLRTTEQAKNTTATLTYPTFDSDVEYVDWIGYLVELILLPDTDVEDFEINAERYRYPAEVQAKLASGDDWGLIETRHFPLN